MGMRGFHCGLSTKTPRSRGAGAAREPTSPPSRGRGSGGKALTSAAGR
jgi:hypothetical protein